MAARSYACCCAANCSSSSATLSPRPSLIDLSSIANTSQSCIACLAVSNSSRANASRRMRSSLSLIQFCCVVLARLRKSATSWALSSRSLPMSDICFCNASFCSCTILLCFCSDSLSSCDCLFCSSSSSIWFLACARSSYNGCQYFNTNIDVRSNVPRPP